MKVVLFDLDGVLCDNSHRAHLVPPKHLQHKNSAWHDYVSECDKDTVITAGAELYKALLRHHYVVIVTSRQEVFRGKTERWLHTNFGGNHLIAHRANDDESSPAEFKEKVLKDSLERGYEIIFAVDDDPAIVAMYNGNGIHTFQPSTRCASCK